VNFFKLLKRNLIYKFKKKIDIDNDNFKEKNNLEKLFSFYKTDKANIIKNTNQKGHGYSDFYQKHFSEIKNKNINILEIGSYSGASAAAFSKYFDNVNIYCLDVNLTNFKYKSKKIHPFGIDANNLSLVNNFFKKIKFFETIKKFDIIIDDGSHLLSDQLKSLNFFLQHVKNNGFYVIEEYKFSEYFKHLKDTDQQNIRNVIESIKNGKIVKNDFLTKTALDILNTNRSNIFEYKGQTPYSDILFVKIVN
tara:strand:+ start:5188 stop:5937 length:750 start_codon:yes stop_codon:yes gene_type:complete